jgi:DNA-binding MarR family transcriptional regulator
MNSYLAAYINIARVPRQPSPDEQLAVALYDLAWLLPRTVGAEGARRDPMPPTELEIMKLLVRRPGLSVTEIARDLGLQPSNVSTAVRALTERGMIERRTHENDARVGMLHPTNDAIQNRRAREHGWGRELERVLDDLPPASARQLRNAVPALQDLAAALAGDPNRY